MGKNLKVRLVIIDPQNDFCDGDSRATLPVAGAKDDMVRLSGLIDRVGKKLNGITVTLDSHNLIDIAHPAWWRGQDGKQPIPFTIISAADIQAGIWVPRKPELLKRTLAYAKSLEAGGNYKICVWPAHCLIGTWGHNVHETLNTALQNWCNNEFVTVDYVTKGSNPFTEHYGALMAEVPDANDPGTSLNTEFLSILAETDIIAVAGEASSHCVLTTVKQIAENIGDEHLKKFHILTDCMSPVGALPGLDFPAIAKEFFADMEKRGMVLTNSIDFLR